MRAHAAGRLRFRFCLDEAKHNPTMWAKVSEIQANAIASSLEKIGVLPPDEAIEITRLITDIQWASERDSSKVLAMVTVQEASAERRRRSTQDYLNIHNYFSAEQWEVGSAP